MTGSLEGIRVVDVTTSVAGPFATQILGDLGADVIKVERPEVGDDTRKWGPPFWGEDHESATFMALNRNKRSLVLDLKAPDDRDRFWRLLESADVFVQNLRPGAMDKLGFGHEAVAEANPQLIYCDMSGYGRAGGPLSDRPAYDPLMQAFAGLMSLTGEEGRPPVRIPVSILDQGTGMWSVIGVLDALRERERTGRGGLVQTSLLNTALMWLPAQFTGYFAAGTVPPRLGSGTIGIYPYAAFPTADNYIVIAAGNQNLWQTLCHTIDRDDLLSDPRFESNPRRSENRAELFEILSATLRTKTSRAWLDKLVEAGVPCSPVNTLDEVATHEQVEAIDGLPSLQHPRIEGYRTVSLPLLRNGGYPPVRRVPPLLGEHTEEILDELADERTGAPRTVSSPRRQR